MRNAQSTGKASGRGYHDFIGRHGLPGMAIVHYDRHIGYLRYRCNNER